MCGFSSNFAFLSINEIYKLTASREIRLSNLYSSYPSSQNSAIGIVCYLNQNINNYVFSNATIFNTN